MMHFFVYLYTKFDIKYSLQYRISLPLSSFRLTYCEKWRKSEGKDCIAFHRNKEAPEGAVDSNKEGVCSVHSKSEVLIVFMINNFMLVVSLLIANTSFHCRFSVVGKYFLYLIYSSVTVWSAVIGDNLWKTLQDKTRQDNTRNLTKRWLRVDHIMKNWNSLSESTAAASESRRGLFPTWMLVFLL